MRAGDQIGWPIICCVLMSWLGAAMLTFAAMFIPPTMPPAMPMCCCW